jgi:hypothetical protein
LEKLLTEAGKVENSLENLTVTELKSAKEMIWTCQNKSKNKTAKC